MLQLETMPGGPEGLPPTCEPFKTDLTEEDVDDALNAFTNFIELPLEEREKVTYFDEARPRTSGAGYWYKGEFAPDGSPYKDNKHVFHYTQGMFDPLTLATRGLAQEARSFLAIAHDQHEAMSEAVADACDGWESDVRGITGILAPLTGKTAHHTRYLAYQRGKIMPEVEVPRQAHTRTLGRILAQYHYDKSWGTVAEKAKEPGLVVGTGPDDMEYVDHEGYNPVFFPGFGYHQLAEMLDIDVVRKAGWHGVEQQTTTPEDAQPEDPIRLSRVFFINPANIYLDSSSEQTHTPIMWRKPYPYARTVHDQSFLV